MCVQTVHVIQTRTLYFYRFCLLLALVQCDYEAINHAKSNLKKKSNCETLLLPFSQICFFSCLSIFDLQSYNIHCFELLYFNIDILLREDGCNTTTLVNKQ